MSAARLFRVRIEYREPTYELYAGSREQPYEWTARVHADDPDQALRRALAEFRAMARDSSVSWTREVVNVVLDERSGRDN